MDSVGRHAASIRISERSRYSADLLANPGLRPTDPELDAEGLRRREYVDSEGLGLENRPVHRERQYLVSNSADCPHAAHYKPFRRTLDVEAVKGWLSECDASHPECKPSEESKSDADLHVIDCLTKTMVSPTVPYEYAALSYLWGTSAPADPAASPTSPLPSAPATIADAMAVVLRLGMRYLWVDRYCIAGHGPERQRLIARMDTVYTGAALTIIAAAGDGPEHGLPGVSREYLQWTSRPLPDGCSVVALPSPVKDIGCTIWSTRGWTYQEGLLSRRRLVFTDYQVYFQCLRRHYCEHWTVSSAIVNYFPKRVPTAPEADPRRIIDRINEYSVRQLSYRSDSLQAFLGIFRDYRKRGVYHFWGMPIYRDFGGAGHYSLRPAHLVWGLWIRNPANDILSGQDRQDNLVRVPEVPSFSWAGWRGFTEDRTPFPLAASKDVRGGQATGHEATVEFRLRDDETGPLVNAEEVVTGILLAHGEEFDLHLEPHLAVTGWTTEVRLQPHPGDDIPSQRFLSPGIQEYSDLLRVTIDPQVDDALYQRLTTETWTALFVVREDLPQLHWYGLLLDPCAELERGHFTRVGVFRTCWDLHGFRGAEGLAARGMFIDGRLFRRGTCFIH